MYLLEELGEEQVLNVTARYQEKYGSEVLLYRFLLKRNLELYQGEGLVAKFSSDAVEKSLAETELLI